MGKRLMSSDLGPCVAIGVRALCIDPGPTECGVAVLEYYFNGGEIRVAWAGKMPWKDICTLIIDGPMQKFNAVMMEDLVPAHGNQMVASKYLVETAIGMGRVIQECDRCGIQYGRLSRRMIIKTLRGKAPSPKNKVSKADMQETVRLILGLDKPIRPQHANDAVCAGLAQLGHPNLPNVTEAATNGTTKRPRQKAKRRRTTSKA